VAGLLQGWRLTDRLPAAIIAQYSQQFSPDQYHWSRRCQRTDWILCTVAVACACVTWRWWNTPV